MLGLTTVVRDVPSASNPSIGRWRSSGTKAEQCLKGGHRLPTTIVPKHELIQVDLKLRLADPMVGTDQPLQVPDRTVRKRHHRGYIFAELRPERLRTGNVLNLCRRNALETFQAIGVNRRSRCDGLLDEIDHRCLLEVRDHSHPDPTRDTAPLPFGASDPPSLGESFFGFEEDEIAVFGELSYSFADYWTLSVGGRFFDYEQSDTQASYGLGGRPGGDLNFQFSEKGEEDAFTPRAVLSYQPNDNVNLYGLVLAQIAGDF